MKSSSRTNLEAFEELAASTRSSAPNGEGWTTDELAGLLEITPNEMRKLLAQASEEGRLIRTELKVWNDWAGKNVRRVYYRLEPKK